MGVISKRNGKILMALGMLLIITGFFGMMILYSLFGESSWKVELYMTLGMFFASSFFILGPIFTVVGIPVFIVSSKRIPSKLINILKSSTHMRTKISFLAQKLAINEKDVISTISRPKSNGEPVLVDDSTLEVIYDPTLLPPSTEIKKPSMTLYEKLSVVLALLSIIVTIIVAYMQSK